jgi:hypothetical protein
VLRVRALRPLRVLTMFLLVNVGWLMFRETDVHQLLRDLALRPGSDSPAQRMAAGHFLGMIGCYSSPLWIDSGLYLGRVYQSARATLGWALAEGATALLLIVAMAVFSSEVSSDFIYFQF